MVRHKCEIHRGIITAAGEAGRPRHTPGKHKGMSSVIFQVRMAISLRAPPAGRSSFPQPTKSFERSAEHRRQGKVEINLSLAAMITGGNLVAICE